MAFYSNNSGDMKTYNPRKFRLHYRNVLLIELLNFLIQMANDNTTWENIQHQLPAVRIYKHYKNLTKYSVDKSSIAFPTRPVEAFLFLYPRHLMDIAEVKLSKKGTNQKFLLLTLSMLKILPPTATRRTTGVAFQMFTLFNMHITSLKLPRKK